MFVYAVLDGVSAQKVRIKTQRRRKSLLQNLQIIIIISS